MLLRKISPSQKPKDCMIPPAWGLHSCQTSRDWKYNSGCQGPRGGGRASQCLVGAELQLGKTRTFSRWLVVMAAPQCEMYLQHWTLRLKMVSFKLPTFQPNKKRIEMSVQGRGSWGQRIGDSKRPMKALLRGKETHSQLGGLQRSTWSQLGHEALGGLSYTPTRVGFPQLVITARIGNSL